MRRSVLLAFAVVVAASIGACGGDSSSGSSQGAATAQAGTAPAEAATGTTATTLSSPRQLRVPADYPTIQQAVDASRPGNLILVSKGVYREAVTVRPDHPRIVIRGVDRNGVILDGGDKLPNGISVQAAAVAVENLTVRRYLVNGVVWSTDYDAAAGGQYLEGWRGSYLTVYDNGLYGVYAFGSANGRFDHVYASGHPDSGIYVGRCKPCNALVRDSVAEHNHVGYEATNASGGVTVVGNVLRANRVGVQINSLTKERAAPQIGSLLEANLIVGNDDAKAPRGSNGFGAGVVINGGSENTVTRNRIAGNPVAGVVVTDSPDYRARNNSVRGNSLSDNGVDLVLDAPAGNSQGNCFPGNDTTRTLPRGIGTLPCETSARVAASGFAPPTAPPQVDYRDVPAPPPQPNMPHALTASPQPARGLPEPVNAKIQPIPEGN